MSNVLVYSGPGVSSSALSHTLKTLRLLLPSYDVQCISAESLALDPWMASTSLLVLPGGRDLPYVDHLATSHRVSATSPPLRADERIKAYVQERGGTFLGICAGAYYASSFCEFEKGDAQMQVVGERTALQFYPGTCRGTVFPGFVYESDKGARMVELQGAAMDKCTTYYNGGGAFIDAERFQAQGVEVLARYVSEDKAGSRSDAESSIKAGFAGQAAVVQCQVGKGRALLFGTHPEFPLVGGERPTDLTAAPEAIPAEPLDMLERQRLVSFARQLQALGLRVQLPVEGEERPAGPKLTPILLTAREPDMVRSVLRALQSAAATPSSQGALHTLVRGDRQTALFAIADSNDTMQFYDVKQTLELFQACARADYSTYTSAVVAPSSDEARAGDVDEREVDLNKVPKCIIAFQDTHQADMHLTPHWDAAAFYAFLQEARRRIEQTVHKSWASGVLENGGGGGPNWGSPAGEYLLADISTYSQMVTSTQTMLDKNFKLLTRLPSGFTSFATHQASGRGRGKNAWISPLGCLQFSTLLHFSPSTLARSGTGGIVFVQYLAALAIVESVRSGMLGSEYCVIGEKMRIKWPNDVYAEVGPADQDEGERKGTFVHHGKRLAKMAGVLVNSQFTGNQVSLVVGCGINTLNDRPTTSLSDLIQAYNRRTTPDAPGSEKLASVSQERFAGAILATFERMWNTFVSAGGSFEPFVDAYRQAWLHS